MAKPEVLNRIKETEREANEIIDEAEADREETIASARERAREIRENAEEEAESIEQDLIEDAREDIEDERSVIIDEGRAQREQLESSAREEFDEITDYVLTLFKEAVHAQT